MISQVMNWIDSPNNVFRLQGCEFEISTPPEEAPVRSVTLDFDKGRLMCRLVFWESGEGHIEVLDFETEKLLINESFNQSEEFAKSVPFEGLLNRLAD